MVTVKDLTQLTLRDYGKRSRTKRTGGEKSMSVCCIW